MVLIHHNYSYIYAKMLRSTQHIITTTKLFNMSMHVEKIGWKSFLVHAPNQKKDNHSNLMKVCPISLLPVLSTVLEHHMSNLLMNMHLLEHTPSPLYNVALETHKQFCRDDTF